VKASVVSSKSSNKDSVVIMSLHNTEQNTHTHLN